MKVKVLNNYGGVYTNEKRILPGVYDASEIPQAALDHMIETGHAVYVEALPDTIWHVSEATKSEIQAILDKRGIEYTTRNTKAELIELLESGS